MSAEATILLRRISDGDRDAAKELLPLVYADLRDRASLYFRNQPADHTLQPTALVHEAYLKLIDSQDAKWNDRTHFCAVAATAMRQILIDHARRRKLARDARESQATMMNAPSGDWTVDLLDLDGALNRLATLDERHARIVELRFFGSLTIEQTARAMEVSDSTIEKEWRKIRAWLIREMAGERAE
ncbi:MAG: sigma-70 family RNA polymerase sigma factor [Phycisphaerales bacterium]|nr:sigma-70 family RNA polymerase sigma factor [Phycisphaerales bacterium]MCB9855483.1 sigma-70 family RNA polymerase sigma factor [Phycisphaerales bacterium]MCB9864260.1 sigma-70 family RNA polymerase sigma factor [Phycisphaerales bacterium]